MNRRGFLNLLGIGAAALTLDPERLLWVPGKKLISIPKPRLTNEWQTIHMVEMWANQPPGGYIFKLMDLNGNVFHTRIETDCPFVVIPHTQLYSFNARIHPDYDAHPV